MRARDLFPDLMPPSPSEVERFWSWFREQAPGFGAAFENEASLSELDRRVLALGDYVWELGPGLREPNRFVISPGGDRGLLPETEQIVARAPSMSAWEFHSAKPPKNWDLRFTIRNEEEEDVSLDASTWRYEVRGETEAGLVLAIAGSDLERLDERHATWAAEIALDGILGERDRLRRIQTVIVGALLGPGQHLGELETRLAGASSN